MQDENIIKRPNGISYRISVSFWEDNARMKIVWNVSVYTRGKGKRKWHDVHDSGNFTWRRMNTEDRAKDIHKTHLEHVTKEELYKVKLDLWKKMKPTLAMEDG